MSLARLALVMPLIGILCSIGCASHRPFPASSLTGGVFEVQIAESVTPVAATVKRGEEVRWSNGSKTPVDISVVQTREELISCQKGFASTNLGYMFGMSDYENIVMATVQPNEFASLCFAIPGKYVYTVRTHPGDRSSTITGSIVVE